MPDWRCPFSREQAERLKNSNADFFGDDNFALHHIISRDSISRWVDDFSALRGADRSRQLHGLADDFMAFVQGTLPNSAFADSTVRQEFKRQCSEDVNAHIFEAVLSNLPVNLIAAPELRVQDPGNCVDLETSAADPEGGRRVVSDRAVHLLEASRCVDAFVRSSWAFLRAGGTNEDLLEVVREHLQAARRSFASAAALLPDGQIPNVDRTLWHQNDDGKWQMKGAGRHHEDAAVVGRLLERRPYDLQSRGLQWSQDVLLRLRDEGIPKDVTVNFVLPASTSQHIFERHSYRYFNGDIQLVNSFWPADVPWETIWEQIKVYARKVAHAVRDSLQDSPVDRFWQDFRDNVYDFPFVPGVFYIANAEWTYEGESAKEVVNIHFTTIAPDDMHCEKVSQTLLTAAW
eukprot:TRINITY_DN92196_c0_g1_i1.p1 TRINITY_DN92196_c0_g1~~TRINITY_DN92196_c0_g1_i1.p1  ORF type:complete len:427 (+),score=46.74 TRINITY_DN92196_c0_g1_i1:75-1283(+)